MKKFTFMALAAIAAISISSCGNKTPKADLKSDIDTLSYAIGMAQSNGLSQYLVERMGVDSTYVDDFIKGLNEGVSAGDDKKKAAYYAGIQIGQQISNQMIKGINHEIFGLYKDYLSEELHVWFHKRIYRQGRPDVYGAGWRDSTDNDGAGQGAQHGGPVQRQ